MKNHNYQFLEASDDLVKRVPAPAFSVQPILGSAELASLMWNKAVKEILARSSFNALKHNEPTRPKKIKILGP
jgi:hypothetical protein